MKKRTNDNLTTTNPPNTNNLVQMICAHGCQIHNELNPKPHDCFIVPKNTNIIFLNGAGVLSDQESEIMFLKNLSEYNNILSYFTNPTFYMSHYDKKEKDSYRHENVFKKNCLLLMYQICYIIMKCILAVHNVQNYMSI